MRENTAYPPFEPQRAKPDRVPKRRPYRKLHAQHAVEQLQSNLQRHILQQSSRETFPIVPSPNQHGTTRLGVGVGVEKVLEQPANNIEWRAWERAKQIEGNL